MAVVVAGSSACGTEQWSSDCVASRASLSRFMPKHARTAGGQGGIWVGQRPANLPNEREPGSSLEHQGKAKATHAHVMAITAR